GARLVAGVGGNPDGCTFVDVFDIVMLGGEQRVGFNVHALAVGDLVAVVFDLLFQEWDVLEVVGVQVALIHLTVWQLVVIKFHDVNFQAGIGAELFRNVLQNLTVGDRGGADGQSGDAIFIGAWAFSLFGSATACGQHER